MKLIKLLTLVLLLLPALVFSQYPVLERQYLPGTAMIKVMVCTDDLTVFALSSTGKVYYKKLYDPDFQLYQPAVNLTVTDLAGYNFDEMYFLVAPDVVHSFIQGIPGQIKVLNSGVTTINNIAIMNAKRTDALQGYYGQKDWLAIATNNGMYPVFRGDGFASARYNRNASAPGAEGNWRITNSSYDRVDFQYETTNESVCYPTAKHAYHNPAFATTYLPEDAPYSPKVNCTLFENIFYDSTLRDRLNFWGTDDGIFLKVRKTCDAEITRFLPGVVINDLEELETYKDVLDDRYIYAATNQGFYFTRESVKYRPDTVHFVPVRGVEEKVNSFAFQVYRDGDAITEDSVATCQQTIWAATEKGIKQLKIKFDLIRQYFGMSVIPRPMYGAGASGPIWNFCGDETVHFTMDITNFNPGRFVIRWSNRDVFVDSLQNKLSVDLATGEWQAHLIALCEGVDTKSGTFYIRKLPEPTVQIGFTGSQYACPGGTLKLITDPQYVVQWQKDGVDIPDANYTTYTATTAGKYRVMANTCNGHYTPSKEVEFFVESLPTIALSRSSTRSLCYGESVKLSAPVINGVSYKWSTGETTREIDVKKSGDYFVTVTRSGCSEISNTESVTVSEQIFPDPTQNLKICLERNEHLTLTAPAGYPAYIWNGVRTTENTFEVTEAGQYILRIEDAEGCTESTTYVVVPGCPGVDLTKAVVPNAFSPNGDGVNDTWVVQGLNDNTDARITIYNRFGNLVFEGKGDNPVWDGKYMHQTLASGTYYYVISDVNGTKPLKGSVTLIR